jgi:hypothetical protein
MKPFHRPGIAVFCAVTALFGCADRPVPDPRTAEAARTGARSASGPADVRLTSPERIESAFENREENVPVTVAGTVVRILKDERDGVGSDHQRFIIRLADGRTVLIVHNIDVAPRVSGLSAGSEVTVRGEYVWNPKGGLIHWTHRDPDGSHGGGWIRFGGRTIE